MRKKKWKNQMFDKGWTNTAQLKFFIGWTVFVIIVVSLGYTLLKSLYWYVAAINIQ